MNIFFLSMNPEELAYMYCDQHVIKILLEICQMMYTAWFYSDQTEYVESNAPYTCLLYTSPSPRDMRRSRMPSSA